MFRRTKIVTTLGPATDHGDTLERLILAGANVVRLNFSHGSAEDHARRAHQVRLIAEKHNCQIGILGDLQGPKIRVSTFAEGKVQLRQGEQFILDSELPRGAGNQEQVGLDYKALPDDVSVGDTLLLDDGRVQLLVESIDGKKVITRVLVGGPLSDKKGINKLGGGLSAEALTDKDKQDIKTAAQIGVDYLAVSFPRSGKDMDYARQLAQEAGCTAKLVAKVERAETVATPEAIDDIISASDAVMVARGDLGVEIGDPELVGVQKKLVARCRQLNRIVITATQMMESMIANPMPTRAEVMDVANAVLDGTDAVMLSAETAAGDYPVETVESMARVCLGAEKHPRVHVSKHRLDDRFTTIEETIALSTMYAANHLEGVTAIISLTESGNTTRIMSRITSPLPIVGLSRHEQCLNQMALYRGVYPMAFDSTKHPPGGVSQAAVEHVKQAGLIQPGDKVLVTKGDVMGTVGATNSCKILEVQ